MVRGAWDKGWWKTDEREGEDFVSRNKNKLENPFFPPFAVFKLLIIFYIYF